MSPLWHIDHATLRDVCNDAVALEAELATAEPLERIWMLRLLGRLDEAREEGIAALRKSSDRFRPLLLLADVYRWLDSFDIAAPLQREALNLAVGTQREPVARQHIGKRLFDEGRYKEAAEQFRLALDMRIALSKPDSLVDSSRMALVRAQELATP